MARIAGVDLPRNKRMEIALTYIYGIGRSASKKILQGAGVPFDTKTDNLNDDEVVKIRQIIDQSYKVEGDLRRDITQNIKRHVEVGSYRGLRPRFCAAPCACARWCASAARARGRAKPWPARSRPRPRDKIA